MSDQVNFACESLARAAATTDGLRAKPYADDKVNSPEAHVLTREYDPRMTLGGSPKRPVALTLRVFVNRQSLKNAQRTLRSFMEQSGPTSVIESLENSDNWPEDTDYVEVVRISGPFEVAAADATYLAVDFDVDVVM